MSARSDDIPATGGGDTAEWKGLKDDVGELAEAAVRQGRSFLDGAKGQATHFADEQKNFAAQAVSGFARSLREATNGFENRPNIQAFVDSAAGGLDDLAETIRERSFGEIVGDVEDMMRRRPVAVAATGLALGFFAARFIKASAQDLREETAQRAAARRSMAGRRRDESDEPQREEFP